MDQTPMQIVHPGWVASVNDGDRHFIGYVQLCRLYGLNPYRAFDARNCEGRAIPDDAEHYYPQRHHENYRRNR